MELGLCEQETVLVLNVLEMRAGFFRFSTTRLWDWNRLLKRVGGEGNLLEVRHIKSGSKVIGWECRVPVRYLSKATFGIRPERKRMTDERKAYLRGLLGKVRTEKAA